MPLLLSLPTCCRADIFFCVALVVGLMSVAATPVLAAQEAGRGGVYSVVELTFRGPQQGPADAPARDIDFWVRFQHESGAPAYKIHGFWDGDGKGGSSGNVFKVRFCPTRTGRWDIVETHSNHAALAKQRQGDHVSATPSDHKGFWVVDGQSPGRRWYGRSNGSHQYVYGNTFYSFLSETYLDNAPSGSDIATDIQRNARYFKKLRFSPISDRYPHPKDAPFFDKSGAATYDGDSSHRPNPQWFHRRADLAVRTAFEHDLIADLIVAGVDLPTTRAALRAAENGGDPGPFLKYIAARYGAYPNVWFCVINEFDLYEVNYTPAQVVQFGRTFQGFLAYPSPLSVHKSPRGTWLTELNTTPPWNDHVILQKKIRDLPTAADAIGTAFAAGGGDKPVVNDELSYQGAGDKHSEGDTIESHLGAFLGGGYGTTGYKSGDKLGQYFAGNFDASEHTAAESLRWLRDRIDAHVTFWKMAPDQSIFSNLDPAGRGMAWAGHEYVLGTNKARPGIVAQLPAGTWTVTRYDVMARKETTLSTQAAGRFTFDAPGSRAVLFHLKRNGNALPTTPTE